MFQEQFYHHYRPWTTNEEKVSIVIKTHSILKIEEFVLAKTQPKSKGVRCP